MTSVYNYDDSEYDSAEDSDFTSQSSDASSDASRLEDSPISSDDDDHPSVSRRTSLTSHPAPSKKNDNRSVQFSENQNASVKRKDKTRASQKQKPRSPSTGKKSATKKQKLTRAKLQETEDDNTNDESVQDELHIRDDSEDDEHALLPTASGYPVTIDHRQWQSVEHYILAQRYIDHPKLVAKILATKSPMQLQDLIEGDAFQDKDREDWEDIRYGITKRAMLKKLEQYPKLEQQLLDTGEMPIYYDNDDMYWGTGRRGDGENQMGHLLMELRSKLDAPDVHVERKSAVAKKNRAITTPNANSSAPNKQNGRSEKNAPVSRNTSSTSSVSKKSKALKNEDESGFVIRLLVSPVHVNFKSGKTYAYDTLKTYRLTDNVSAGETLQPYQAVQRKLKYIVEHAGPEFAIRFEKYNCLVAVLDKSTRQVVVFLLWIDKRRPSYPSSTKSPVYEYRNTGTYLQEVWALEDEMTEDQFADLDFKLDTKSNSIFLAE